MKIKNTPIILFVRVFINNTQQTTWRYSSLLLHASNWSNGGELKQPELEDNPHMKIGATGKWGLIKCPVRFPKQLCWISQTPKQTQDRITGGQIASWLTEFLPVLLLSVGKYLGRRKYSSSLVSIYPIQFTKKKKISLLRNFPTATRYQQFRSRFSWYSLNGVCAVITRTCKEYTFMRQVCSSLTSSCLQSRREFNMGMINAEHS